LLFWETTAKCNLHCAHCRRVELDESAHKDLSTANALELIGQLAHLGKRQGFMPVLVFSGGEPLCRDDLFRLVSQARSVDLVCALATNATLIDEKTAEQIKDAGIARVAVSLDGATPEVHNRLRRMEGSFEAALEGMARLREKQVPFQINVTLSKHNAGQLEDIYELARSVGAVAVHFFMLVPVGCGLVLAQTDMLSPRQYEQMLARICELEGRGRLEIKVTCGPHYERIKRQKGLLKASVHSKGDMQGKTSQGSRRGCLAGSGVLFVGHQGDVFPCGYLPVKCGNILEQNLVDIWYNNKDLARMRDINALEGKCGVCEFRYICGGCRARAYAEAGNYMAAEPFCVYTPPAAGSQEESR